MKLRLEIWKRSILSHTPGTQLFRRAYQRRILKLARKRLDLFKGLHTLDSQTKQRLLRPIRHSENRLSTVTTLQNDIDNIAINVIAVLAVSWLYISNSTTTGMWYNINHSLLTRVSIWTISCFFSPIVLIMLMLPFTVKLHRYLNFASFRLGWMSVVFIIYSMLVYRVNSGNLSPEKPLGIILINALVGGFGCLLVGLFLSLIVALPVRLSLYRRKRKLYPDLLIIDRLLTMLSHVENNTIAWNKLRFKQHLLFNTEQIAALMQHDLPLQLKSGDIATDLWISERFRKIAAAIRGLKKWIVTPKSDTREQFKEHLANCLIYAASGDWDSFEQSEPEKLSHPQHWRSQIGTTVRVIISGTTPIFIWGIVQQTVLAIEGAIAEYVTIGVILWAVITFLTSLDPLYGSKITAIREITQLLPFSSGKKE